MSKIIPLAVAAAALGACATVPKSLQGEYPTSTPKTTQAAGQAVRWGGEVIAVEPKAGATCIEILARQLGSTTRPLATDRSDGRFYACQSGFLEPGDYPKGREVTVIGRVDGTITGRVGEFDYVYPKVDATTIHLWPVRAERVAGYGPGFHDPFWGPWGGRGYYGNWWYQPRPIIIVKPTPPPPPSSGKR